MVEQTGTALRKEAAVLDCDGFIVITNRQGNWKSAKQNCEKKTTKTVRKKLPTSYSEKTT